MFRYSCSGSSKTFKNGNFPVGAVLTIDDEIIGKEINSVNTTKTFFNHAENILMQRHGKELYNAFNQHKEVCLYTTLEPCLQCLGTASINCVSKIFFIQKDPNGGACSIDKKSIGLHYQERWPEIKHVPYTEKPKTLMINFFEQEIEKGNKVKWCKKMIALLN